MLAPVAPMLAAPGAVPAGHGWAFEFKWDGARATVGVDGSEVCAWSRNARVITDHYPELRTLASVTRRPVLLDGELVALDEHGRPDFGRLQTRIHVQAPGRKLLEQVPVAFLVFDVLHHDGTDLTTAPYERRRETLVELELERPPGVRVPQHYTDVDGQALLDVAREHGLEGVVAKRLGSRYEPGRRSRSWLKTPLRLFQEVVIGGWAPGEGRRAGLLGSLLLGVYDQQGAFAFCGHVGTGFTDRALVEVQRLLEPIARPTSPFATPVPRMYALAARWVEPLLVGEVEIRAWTADQRLRHPSWRGFRVDRDPRTIMRAAGG